MKDAAKPLRIITRQEASEQKLTRYYTGEPCRSGHVAERLTCNAHCVDCAAAYLQKHYGKNRTAILAGKKEYYRLNAETIKQRSRAYRARKAAEKTATINQ